MDIQYTKEDLGVLLEMCRDGITSTVTSYAVNEITKSITNRYYNPLVSTDFFNASNQAEQIQIFIFTTEFKKLPLFTNLPSYGTLLRWRLRIGK